MSQAGSCEKNHSCYACRQLRYLWNSKEIEASRRTSVGFITIWPHACLTSTQYRLHMLVKRMLTFLSSKGTYGMSIWYFHSAHNIIRIENRWRYTGNTWSKKCVQYCPSFKWWHEHDSLISPISSTEQHLTTAMTWQFLSIS